MPMSTCVSYSLSIGRKIRTRNILHTHRNASVNAEFNVWKVKCFSEEHPEDSPCIFVFSCKFVTRKYLHDCWISNSRHIFSWSTKSWDFPCSIIAFTDETRVDRNYIRNFQNQHQLVQENLHIVSTEHASINSEKMRWLLILVVSS
jgi:hypothetical protein